jgi:predicted P-loop ATPase
LSPEEKLERAGIHRLMPTDDAKLERPPRDNGGARRPIVIKRSLLTKMIKDDRGRPVSNVANVLAVLRGMSEVKHCFSYDEMLCATMIVAPLPVPFGAFANEAGDARLVRDTDVTQLQEWLQHIGLPKIGRDQVFEAVDLRAMERRHHPVRDYLDSLVWDRVPRLSKLFSAYFGADHSPYVEGIGPMFLSAMVARIFDPGCKADYMIILEGPQGGLKSTACAILGDRWFSDHMPDLGSGKDVSQHLAGKWLIEIAEMSAMRKAEDHALKAFITRPVERYRPSYGRQEIIQPRQCIFIASTNNSTYLRDETGARRYWPVKVGTIDTTALSRDRNQLFAEAVALYRNGARWGPDGAFERQHIQPEQEARYEADPWQETIIDWLGGKSKVTVGEVARLALHIETQRLATVDSRRIASILERLKWRRGKKDWKGNIPWFAPQCGPIQP